MYFHVTPLKNMDSILAHGLSPFVSEANFNCRRQVYLTDSMKSAERWAGEIARETGEDRFAILSVDVPALIMTSTSVAPQGTYDGVIASSVIKVATILHDVSPVFNLDRLLTFGVPGYRFCVECEMNVIDDSDCIEEHLLNFHEDIAGVEDLEIDMRS